MDEEKTKKVTMGVKAFPEDRLLIYAAAKAQRRSMASFIIEAAITKARIVLKESFSEAPTNAKS